MNDAEGLSVEVALFVRVVQSLGDLAHDVGSDIGRDARALRMRAMRRIVAGRNVFSWASDILEGLESLVP